MIRVIFFMEFIQVLMYFKLYGSGVDELAIFSGLYTNQYKDVWLTTTKSSASSWRKADFHFTPRQRRTRIILDGVLGRGHGGQIEVDYILIAPYEVNCYTGNGVYYRGSITKTISGYNCQQWKSNSPHNHSYSPSKYPDDDLSYNYCRNPGGKSSRPWCYTTNSQKVSEYCNIPSCYGGSTTTSYPLRTTTKSLGTQMQITESVQLSNYLSGVVEIKAHGVWGYMCAENLSNNTANVLCRQMGYYVSSRHYPGSPLNPQSSYQVASYNCTGLESSIEHCPSLRNTNGSYICNNPQSVAVVACEQSSGNTTSCKFDKGFCGWSQPQRNLRMDWTWQSNYIFPGTNFKKSDPSIVVSTRNGFYLDKAILRSPQQSFQSSIVTIRFKYYLSSSGSVLTLKVDENNKIIKKMSHDTNGAWISVYTEVLPSVKTFTISFVVMKTSSESVIVGLDDISIVGITPEPFVRKCIRATVATALILGCILLMICQICKKKPLRTIADENPPTYDQIVPPEDESPTEHDIIPDELTTNRINDNMEREQVRSCPRNGTADRSIISPNTVRSRESLTAEV
ncbi:uncharacterized protein TRIADDRAFT_51898 [Trichoplax adhaerens]|uniref:Kringle domain-containing protein n=1 Tax=Trichoplax adhaerens TaxID=10228 RepID=B3RL69_TRIAD|nr:hypothetical protein TRIADDRAFT_51898 [Trichoplax adhaerens]EDV29497.1 hypothetical protein TRIADDRAFT_51898 [Trichoplax adhaerens]|eukprot:XP_002108699.1 hypothetical protein TRIADDRAFT_51898 [Trichoplax adhaerens]